jgi:hypothetical protein
MLTETELDKRIKNFLIDYAKICSKYEIVINGCGCCGSPWLSFEEFNEINLLDNVGHLLNSIDAFEDANYDDFWNFVKSLILLSKKD